MAKLYEIADIIRSKNTGPVTLTIDILFRNQANYVACRDSQIITAPLICEIYGAPEEYVEVIYSDAGQGIKITMPRPIVSGSIGDPDVYACQYYTPLLFLEAEIAIRSTIQ